MNRAGTGNREPGTEASFVDSDPLANLSPRSSAAPQAPADSSVPGSQFPVPGQAASGLQPSLTSERDRDVLRSFAKRIDPSDAGAHNNLGVLYWQKGLASEAIEQFTQALELDPRMEVARANLEIAYRASGHYDRIVAELQERLRRAPSDRDARWELGRAYASLGHHAEAAQEFETLLAWHPNDLAALI